MYVCHVPIIADGAVRHMQGFPEKQKNKLDDYGEPFIDQCCLLA